MDVSTASVSQLKEILKERGVSFEGVVEKNELRELARKALEAPAPAAKKEASGSKQGTGFEFANCCGGRIKIK